MPAWLRNIRRLDRALWLVFAFLACTLFALVGIAVIFKSPERGDQLFGLLLALFSGTAAVAWFQKLKRLYREAVPPKRQTCTNCGQEFTFPAEPSPELATNCPYCGHLVGDLKLD